MNTLVTGASGFLGRQTVAELLSRGQTVTGLVRLPDAVGDLVGAGMRVAEGDLRDPTSIDRAVHGQDVIIHLAAVVGHSEPTWRDYEEIGVDGTRHLLNCAASAGIRKFIHMSSVVVYDPRSEQPLTEASPIRTAFESWDNYARQKVMSERLVLDARSPLFEVASIRAPTVVGSGDANLVPMMQAIASSPLGALARDDGNSFPIVVVEELVKLLADICHSEAPLSGPYNVGSSKLFTKADIITAFGSAGSSHPSRHRLLKGARIADTALSGWENATASLGRSCSTLPRRLLVSWLERHAQRPAQPGIVLDTTKARYAFGWEGSADVLQAIRRAVEWHTNPDDANNMV